MASLAIIIPAFKGKYFKETLQSIENQTCKDFHLYIGDDASQENLELIAKSTLKNTVYTFKRFKNNLGSTDLVAQWTRCIELSVTEKWIWLFSDDDLMSLNAVDHFYRVCKINSNLWIKFIKKNDCSVISDTGIRQLSFSELNVISYFAHLSSEGVSMPEYILHRKLVNRLGFIKFPIAWNSDLATWQKYIYQTKRITLIDSAFVYFRKSEDHISNPNNRNYKIRRIIADYSYIEWASNFYLTLNKTEKESFLNFNRKILYKKMAICMGNIDVLGKQKIILMFYSNIKIFGSINGTKNIFHCLKQSIYE